MNNYKWIPGWEHQQRWICRSIISAKLTKVGLQILYYLLYCNTSFVKRTWKRDIFINQLLVELWLQIWTLLILVQSPEIHIQIHSWKTYGKKISFPCPFNYTPFPFLHSHINSFDSSVGYPWHFGADPDPRIRTSDCWIRMREAQKIGSYGPGSGCRPGTLVHLHHSSKIRKSHRSYKTVEIMVFLTIFARWWKDRDPDPDPYLWLTDPYADPGSPKYPYPDPDPQHCLIGKPSYLMPIQDSG